jgi:prophage regulatory protein
MPVTARYLMGTHEIAALLRVSRQRAQQITARKDFPRPYDVLRMGKVWRRQAVEQWARDHGRAVPGDEGTADENPEPQVG